jgi:hypothetical protein
MPARFNHAPVLTWLALAAAIVIPPLGCGPRAESARRAVKPGENRVVSERAWPALPDIRGVELRPFDDEDAAAVVLVFTMQDCPIANGYVPTLNKLVDEYGPRGVRLLLVHVDSQLTADTARKHAEEYQIKAPVVIDWKHEWVNRAGATRSPEAVVFSPAGEILYSGRIDDRYAGFGKRRAHVSSHDLRDALDAILANRPVARSKTEAIGCFIPTLPTGD